jgi:uncharacterized protein (DUF433 family)
MRNATYGWRQGIAAAVASAAILGGASFTDAQQTAQKPGLEIFSGVIVNAGAAGKPIEPERSDVRVIIERWSTEEERQALVQAYDQKGAAGLLAALRKTKPVGTLRKSIAHSVDLHYAVQVPTENGGRRIIVGTDRPVDSWDADREEKESYPFTLIELRLDKDGKGDGRIAAATKISRSKDGQRIEIEQYFEEPLHLQDVRKRTD